MRRFAIICVLVLGSAIMATAANADTESCNPPSCSGVGVPPTSGGGNLYGPFNIPVSVPLPSNQSAVFCYPNGNMCYGAAFGSNSAVVTLKKSDSATYWYNLGGASVVVDTEKISVTYYPPSAPGAGVAPGSQPQVVPSANPHVCPVAGTRPTC
ncbi:MAG: hypothetical protein WDA27_08905 [Actinomycetota bacterium]